MTEMALTVSLLLLYGFVLVSADQKNITAESGQNVTLTCRAPNNNNIIVVEWSRADLGDKHVLSYRDGHFVPGDQHPSFKNRVDLQDRQMKDGDVSLIVQNVSINDTGTYKCCTVGGETDSCDSISIIYLHVVPPGQTGGHTEDGGKKNGGNEDGVSRGRYGLIASFLLLPVFIAALVVVAKLQKRKLSKDLPSDEPAASCSETIVSLR